MRIYSLVAPFFLTVATTALAQTAMPTPRMAPAEVIQLFENAGFKLVGRQLQNRCGHVVHPRVEFADLNGDGRPEAHVADVDPACYAAPGAYYAIMARNDSGHWGRMIAEDAIVSFDSTRTDGWIDIRVKPGNGACPGQRHYESYSYLEPCLGGKPTTQMAAATPAPSRGGGDPTKGWKMPVKFAALPASEQDAIMRAAGLTRSGEVWKGCDGSSEADNKSVEIKDLNHDGRPEAIVTDGGTACYGNTGQEFTILRATPGGWAQMMQVVGIPIYLKAHGVDGYPDVMIGMPGMCFGVDRWNGSEYKYIGSRYSSNDPDTAKPCKP